MARNPASRRAPVLIVLHQEHSTPGRVGRLLQERGHVLDIRRPRYGDPLPETLERHAGAVIFGGPMSANDPDDFVKREIDWIAERNARLWPSRIGRSALRTIAARSIRVRNRRAGSGAVAMTETQRRDHFRATGGEIAGLLASHGSPVRVCAFGHTHIPDRFATPHATLVNAGSWLESATGDPGAPVGLPFVQITVGDAADEVNALLLEWDDARDDVVPRATASVGHTNPAS